MEINKIFKEKRNITLEIGDVICFKSSFFVNKEAIITHITKNKDLFISNFWDHTEKEILEKFKYDKNGYFLCKKNINYTENELFIIDKALSFFSGIKKVLTFLKKNWQKKWFETFKSERITILLFFSNEVNISKELDNKTIQKIYARLKNWIKSQRDNVNEDIYKNMIIDLVLFRFYFFKKCLLKEQKNIYERIKKSNNKFYYNTDILPKVGDVISDDSTIGIVENICTPFSQDAKDYNNYETGCLVAKTFWQSLPMPINGNYELDDELNFLFRNCENYPLNPYIYESSICRLFYNFYKFWCSEFCFERLTILITASKVGKSFKKTDCLNLKKWIKSQKHLVSSDVYKSMVIDEMIYKFYHNEKIGFCGNVLE